MGDDNPPNLDWVQFNSTSYLKTTVREWSSFTVGKYPIITSSRPPTTTTIPSPPPVRTGRGSTDLLFQNAKISPGQCPGDIFVIIALQGNDAALSVHLFSHCVSARTSHFLCKRAPHIQARGKIKIRSPLQMRRWFLVLYNREEKAGGLAKMQALVLVVLAVITQKKIRPGSGTLF